MNAIGGLIVTLKSNSKANTLLVGMDPLKKPVLPLPFKNKCSDKGKSHQSHTNGANDSPVGQTRGQKGAEGQCGTTSIPLH